MPLVPVLPAIGIFFNFMLACGLDGLTWAYFAIWLAFGLLIYFAYGLWHSHLEPDNIYRGEMEVSLVTYVKDQSIDNGMDNYAPPNVRDSDNGKESDGSDDDFHLQNTNDQIN